MLNKIWSWCRKHWIWVIPALVAIPVLLLKLLGGAARRLLPSLAAPAASPFVDPARADAERKRIKQHAEAARDAADARYDKFMERVNKIKDGDK